MKKHNLPTMQEIHEYVHKNRRKYIIGVDFDNTLSLTQYPLCGNEIKPVCDYIRYIYDPTYTEIILWTCRTGDSLIDALAWCKEHNIPITEVNKQGYFDDTKWTESRKIFCNTLIDDCAYGFDINDFVNYNKERNII